MTRTQNAFFFRGHLKARHIVISLIKEVERSKNMTNSEKRSRTSFLFDIVYMKEPLMIMSPLYEEKTYGDYLASLI